MSLCVVASYVIVTLYVFPNSTLVGPEMVRRSSLEAETTVVNIAVTVLLAFIVTVHCVPFTEVHPVQLVKVEPDAACAVRVAVDQLV